MSDGAPIDWEELARVVGSLGSGAPESSSPQLACAAIECLIGAERISAAVDYYIQHAPGAELARSVLWHLRPWSAMQRCYQIYREAPSVEDRRAAVELLRVVADRRVVPWIYEFLRDPDAVIQMWGIGVLDQLLWSRLVGADESEELLETAERHASEAVRSAQSSSEVCSRIAAMLDRVYWIGGASGAGKSTIARELAAAHDLQLFSTDDAMPDHVRRCCLEQTPLLRAFLAMSMDERWVDRSPRTMLKSFHWFHGEGFDLIVEDLLRLPRERAVIVEGFRLLPALVQPLLAVSRRAVWLLPTVEFRRAAFARRRSDEAFYAKTRDPERALQNLLERDRLSTERLREETSRLELTAIEVDLELAQADLVDRVAGLFGLVQRK